MSLLYSNRFIKSIEPHVKLVALRLPWWPEPRCCCCVIMIDYKTEYARHYLSSTILFFFFFFFSKTNFWITSKNKINHVLTKTFYCWVSWKISSVINFALGTHHFLGKLQEHTVGCPNTQTRLHHVVPLANLSSHLPRRQQEAKWHDPFNPSVHSGKYMYHLTPKMFYAATTSSPNNINRLVCVTKTFCVFCEVATTRCTLDTMCTVRAAAHTSGKLQEHKVPWFPSVFKSLLRLFPSSKLLPQAPLVLPSHFKHIILIPMLKSPTLSCLTLARDPKPRAVLVSSDQMQLHRASVRRSNGRRVRTFKQSAPPPQPTHKVPVICPSFLLPLPFK